MKSKINKLLWDIQQKKNELWEEYAQLKIKYWFKLEGQRVIFNSEAKQRNKFFKKSLMETIFTAQIREIFSIPFIYMMIFPTLILDICLIIYQYTAFKLYNIPLVSRKEYIIYDRKVLDYLNILQKLHCMYCSYVNGVFQYAVEIGGRTEKYWCPIKNASKKSGEHDWEKYFADYWDPEGFKKVFHSVEEFNIMTSTGKKGHKVQSLDEK